MPLLASLKGAVTLPFAGQTQSTSSRALPAALGGSASTVGGTAGIGPTCGGVSSVAGGSVAGCGSGRRGGPGRCTGIGHRQLHERLVRIRHLLAARLDLERGRVAERPRLDGRAGRHERRADRGRGRRGGLRGHARGCGEHEHLSHADLRRIGDAIPCRQLAVVEPVLQRDAHQRLAALHGVRREGLGLGNRGRRGSRRLGGRARRRWGSRSLTGAGARAAQPASRITSATAASFLMRSPAAAARSAPPRICVPRTRRACDRPRAATGHRCRPEAPCARRPRAAASTPPAHAWPKPP